MHSGHRAYKPLLSKACWWQAQDKRGGCVANAHCVASAGGESPKQKGERALKPKYSTQASAAADGRDLDDEVDVEKGLPEQPDSKQPGKVTGDMKTISLSQVDAPTLAEFEVSPPTVLSDWSACSHFFRVLQLHCKCLLLPCIVLKQPRCSVEMAWRLSIGSPAWFTRQESRTQDAKLSGISTQGAERHVAKQLCLVCVPYQPGVDEAEKEAAMLAEEGEREGAGAERLPEERAVPGPPPHLAPVPRCDHPL